jgi:PAS domain S-box-containing protein
LAPILNQQFTTTLFKESNLTFKMSNVIKILDFDQSPNTSTVINTVLWAAGFTRERIILTNESDFSSALKDIHAGIIILNLPEYFIPVALKILEQIHLQVPMVVITGTATWENINKTQAENNIKYISKKDLRYLPLILEQILDQNYANTAPVVSLKNEQALTTLRAGTDTIFEMLDEDMHRIYGSHSLALLTGYETDDKHITAGLEIVHPDDKRAFKHGLKKVKESPGRSTVITFRLKHKNGHYLRLEVKYTNLLHNAEIRAIIANIRDAAKQASINEAVTTSKLTFKRIFKSSMIGMVCWSKDGKILDANDTFFEISGYSKDDLADHTLNLEIITAPEYVHLHKKAYQQIQQSGSCKPYEKELIRKNGKRVPILIGAASLTPSDTDKGIAYIVDLTERKKLQAQYALFELIVNSSHDAIVSINPDGFILSWNQAAERLLGYSAEEILGKHIATIIPEALHKEEEELMARIRSGNKIDHYETIRIRKDGTAFNVSLTVSPIKDADGKIIGASRIMRDITDRIITQQQLKKSELFNLGIINSLKSQLAVLNNKGIIVMVNDQWKQFARNNEDCLLSHTDVGLDYFAACEQATAGSCPDEAGLVRGLKKVLSGAISEYHLEYERHVPAAKRWFALHAVRLNSDEPMIVVLHENITERKIAEEHILFANEELRLLSSHLQNIREQERMQIARDIHDELGQQLTGLKMDVYALKKKLGILRPDVKEKIDEITALIDETVTSVRKIASDLRPSVLDDLGLAAALEWQSKELETRFGIKVNFIAADEELSNLNVNIAISLFRIYQEALTNAVRHSNARLIAAQLTGSDKEIILEVADDGIGMDVEKEHKGHFGIIGIKERVFVLGGKCEFKSEPGKGTYLRVSIPV